VSPEPDILRAIRERPDDDTPRLAYADWVEGHDPERAEFIRVQVALARLPRYDVVCKVCGNTADDDGWLNHGRGCYTQCEDGGGAENVDENPAWSELNRRADRLMYATPPDRDMTYKYVWFDPTDRWPGVTHEFVRGFVERVECSAVEWFRYDKSLRLAHPIRHVTLTTWPGARSSDTFGWMLYDGTHPDKAKMGRFLIDFPPNGTRGREAVAELLKLEWPGVEFDLPPPAPDYNAAYDQFAQWQQEAFEQIAAGFGIPAEMISPAPPSPPA
jgi:uncharacterized protein (TIGR02996 family)